MQLGSVYWGSVFFENKKFLLSAINQDRGALVVAESDSLGDQEASCCFATYCPCCAPVCSQAVRCAP